MTEKKRSGSQVEGKPWTSASEKGNDQTATALGKCLLTLKLMCPKGSDDVHF